METKELLLQEELLEIVGGTIGETSSIHDQGSIEFVSSSTTLSERQLNALRNLAS